MTRLHVLIASLILVSAPLAGCLSEELVDDVLGCMDENALNYDDNATAEALEDCLYMVSMDAFEAAMENSEGNIEDMLNLSTRAGYSLTTSMNGYDADMGMEMDTTMVERVLVDLDRDAVLVQTAMSMDPMIAIDYTHIQVGEVVNVHFSLGGMMAAEAGGAQSGVYSTRDSTPNVLETVHSIIESGGMYDEDCDPDFEDCEDDMGDDGSSLEDDMPEGATTEITYDAETNSFSMTMSFVEDDMDMTMKIHLDESENLMSWSHSGTNDTSTTSMEYVVYWDDAVVIEVDETLPRTSIPIHIDIEGGDMEDVFVCDNGNEISIYSVNDGWDDCGDGSDEPEEVVYVCGSGEEIPFGWVNDGGEDCYDGSDESDVGGDVLFVCDDGEEIYFDWVNDGGADCYDESDEATYEEGEVGEPNFAYILDCTPFVESSAVGDGNPSEMWDGTNLDMTECDGEASGYYTDYVVGDTAITAPYSMMVWGSEEGWSEMTGDSTGEMCEENDGSYDADNDACNFLFELARNDTHIIQPVHNWMEESGAEDEDEASMYCIDWEDGSYDSDNDVCSIPDAEIVDGDGGALVLDWGDDGVMFSFYQLDSTTGSGVLLEMYSTFICDNGEPIDSESYDDGWEDCEDGSDEPGQGEETSEFVCMDGTVIPFSWVHDWGDDCPDGSDEEWYYQGDETSEFVCMDGTVIPFSWVNDWGEDCPDGSDEEWYYQGDDDDDDDDDLPQVVSGFVADNQTLNAPLSDFEVHFLSDCPEDVGEDDEMPEEMPDLNDCTAEFSIPLAGGESNGVTLAYTDHDSDGLVSPGDEVSIDWGDYDGDAEPEIYDTWASEYSAQSYATPPALPGFGAMLAVMTLLGAAFAARRD